MRATPESPGCLLDRCKTLMLDMDGTLLDLAYDNYMWFEHIPAAYALKHDISHERARDDLLARAKRLEGKLNWYCLDHWSEMLDMDIVALHRNENRRIGFLPGAKAFLESLAERSVRVLLVSNSHRHTLDIKNEVTRIVDYFDAVYLSHELGHAKEDQPFWHALQRDEGFDPATTLFIDDNVNVLQSAEDFGLGGLLHITCPDTGRPANRHARFRGVEGVAELNALNRMTG
jgi:putative hydrolase of the HAD superfamily